MTGAAVDIAIDLIIGVGGGVIFLLLQKRAIGKKPGVDAKFDTWHAKWGSKLHITAYLFFSSRRQLFSLWRSFHSCSQHSASA
jgi:hypothetical protein